jgi:glucosamine-phosphate N-acetyltransferase
MHKTMADLLPLPELPAGYVLDALHESDYDAGSLSVLAQLTTVGDVSREDFNNFVSLQSEGETYNTVVIRREETGQVVGIATLLIEAKLIHGFSKVGHIEDVAVDSSVRGLNLGRYIIRTLCNMAVAKGCYKVILDCDLENVPFYEKCGLTEAGIEMQYRP